MAIVATSCRISQQSLLAAKAAFGELDGALVLVDCSSGRTRTFRPDAAKTRLPPCSTFKIVNALIGIEEGIVMSPQQSFYKWDGVERSIPAWNHDLSFREAFQASCVPAFQNLARQIGSKCMQSWIEKIGYGNGNISAGIDVFWLPAKGRQTILISPMEQARMIQKIIAGDVPFSSQTLAVLKELMFIKKTANGCLYGKTGSGTDENSTFVLGWFVGYVESKGETYAFACTTQGKNTISKDARAIVERVFKNRGML
ncbi:MAG: class D beta-lactamase [Candidatus Electrothrix sp. EH2]|nr:class D beta-lactamase [Candidatus Electrothrix sp. EH2]